MNRYIRFFKEAYYHLFEVKPHDNVLAYRKWALRRISKILRRQSSQLELLLPDFSTYITNKHGTFFLPEKSDFVFTISTLFEANLLKYFSVSPEGIFLDIGANAGKYSIIIAKNHPQASVYCFEPSPFTINVLKKNIIANNLSERVKIFNIGLSDKIGELSFAYSPTFTGVSHVLETSTGQYDRFEYEHISVAVNTLDNFVKSENIATRMISLIKIDVEGHETSVLNGAHNVLSAMPLNSRIIIEIHPDKQRTDYIINLLEKFNFSTQRIDEENYVFTKVNG